METGFLRFGGDVKKEQYNFAGLGATGNGASGNGFKSIRIGIRAQVQHLKAYASKENLKQAWKIQLCDKRCFAVCGMAWTERKSNWSRMGYRCKLWL